MGLFSNDKKKVKTVKKSSKPARQKSRAGKNVQTVETVVEVKTVGDIPPMLEARKLLGEEHLEKAASVTYQAARDDYCRYFSRPKPSGTGEREFIIREIKDLKGTIGSGALVDGYSMHEALDGITPSSDMEKERLNALKRLVTYFLNYYEPARFAKSVQFSGDEMLDKFEGIYNYMDIMKLYFADAMRE